MRILRFGPPLAIVFIFAACGSSQPGPVSTLNKYSEALGSKDYGAAYKMMSANFKSKHSKEEFVRMMKDNDREVSETAARLRGPHGDVEISAEFSYGLGDTMRLVREKGSWRVASNPMAFYSQATPRDSIRSFVRAYKLQRWDIMLRFVPNKYRERMDAEKMRVQFQGPRKDEIAEQMNMIEANLDEPIADRGNRARLKYGDRFEVKFVREDDRWKIQDID